MNILIEKSKQLLGELKLLIQSISEEEYRRNILSLSNSTIGQHTRHILEFFECLIDSQQTKMVNYDARKRDFTLEQNKEYTLNFIENIIFQIEFVNIPLELIQEYMIENKTTKVRIDSNYFRELSYNIEHTVHHQALIKVALFELSIISRVDEHFGVADSTISIREKKTKVYK
jgi:hypothetical protein